MKNCKVFILTAVLINCQLGPKRDAIIKPPGKKWHCIDKLKKKVKFGCFLMNTELCDPTGKISRKIVFIHKLKYYFDTYVL